MSSQKYEPVGQSNRSSTSESLPGYDTVLPWNDPNKNALSRAWKFVYALIAVLGIAIVSNGVTLVALYRARSQLDTQGFGKKTAF